MLILDDEVVARMLLLVDVLLSEVSQCLIDRRAINSCKKLNNFAPSLHYQRAETALILILGVLMLM